MYTKTLVASSLHIILNLLNILSQLTRKVESVDDFLSKTNRLINTLKEQRNYLFSKLKLFSS